MWFANMPVVLWPRQRLVQLMLFGAGGFLLVLLWLLITPAPQLFVWLSGLMLTGLALAVTAYMLWLAQLGLLRELSDEVMRSAVLSRRVINNADSNVFWEKLDAVQRAAPGSFERGQKLQQLVDWVSLRPSQPHSNAIALIFSQWALARYAELLQDLEQAAEARATDLRTAIVSHWQLVDAVLVALGPLPALQTMPAKMQLERLARFRVG